MVVETGLVEEDVWRNVRWEVAVLEEVTDGVVHGSLGEVRMLWLLSLGICRVRSILAIRLVLIGLGMRTPCFVESLYSLDSVVLVLTWAGERGRT